MISPQQRKTVKRLARKYREARENVAKEIDNVAAARLRYRTTRKGQDILQELARVVQQNAHGKIAAIVSRCLAAVFPDPYEFRIKFEKRRGRTEAQLVFVRDGIEIRPTDEAGIGCVDVAAFALRLAAILMTNPRPRPLMILDEPFKFVAVEYMPNVRALLEQLSDELGIQFIIVTHSNELEAGTIVRII